MEYDPNQPIHEFLRQIIIDTINAKKKEDARRK
jgi:hypothetical protein